MIFTFYLCFDNEIDQPITWKIETGLSGNTEYVSYERKRKKKLLDQHDINNMTIYQVE